MIHVRNAKCNRLLNCMSAHYTHACVHSTFHTPQCTLCMWIIQHNPMNFEYFQRHTSALDKNETIFSTHNRKNKKKKQTGKLLFNERHKNIQFDQRKINKYTIFGLFIGCSVNWIAYWFYIFRFYSHCILHILFTLCTNILI